MVISILEAIKARKKELFKYGFIIFIAAALIFGLYLSFTSPYKVNVFVESNGFAEMYPESSIIYLDNGTLEGKLELQGFYNNNSFRRGLVNGSREYFRFSNRLYPHNGVGEAVAFPVMNGSEFKLRMYLDYEALQLFRDPVIAYGSSYPYMRNWSGEMVDYRVYKEEVTLKKVNKIGDSPVTFLFVGDFSSIEKSKDSLIFGIGPRNW